MFSRPRGPYLELDNGRKILADYHWDKHVPGYPDRIDVLLDEESNEKYLTPIASITGPFESWEEIHNLAVRSGNNHFGRI